MDTSQYKKLLAEFIKFKSISTGSSYKEDVVNAANWLEKLLTENGFDVQLLQMDDANPIVFASYKVSEDAQTVLVYGHYDVQPASKEDNWYVDPFELVEKDGRLYARGVIDDKGQILVHIYSVIEAIKTNSLKYNVKFLIEGDEETGKTIDIMQKLLKERQDLLKADIVLLSDGELIADHPAMDVSLRGGFNLTLKYKVAENDTHSGLYGGAVPSAAHEISKFIASLYDQNNKCVIPGFYDRVDEITSEELSNNKLKEELSGEIPGNPGYKKLLTEPGYNFYVQIGLRPTVQVTGLKSGYIGEGFSNIVPAKAEAKMNFRIVPPQKSQDVLEAFKKYVADVTPDYVDYEVEVDGVWDAVRINTNSNTFKAVTELLENAYGEKVLLRNCGDSIPFIGSVKELWGIDALSVCFANEDCNMHGVNENFKIDLLEKGLKFSLMFFRK